MKKAKIRQRLKRHVKSRGAHDDFEITETFCLYWWKHLNAAIFDNKLTPPIRFEIKNFRNDCGWCRPWRMNSSTRRVLIGMNITICDREAFLNVLGHEMIHQWEWEIGGVWRESDPHHGQKFFAWSDKLKQNAGLRLERNYDI